MPLNTGITVTTGVGTSTPLRHKIAIAVFGTCSTGTIAAGVLTPITTVEQATTLLGLTPTLTDAQLKDTLPRLVTVLQRYGCANLIACKVTDDTDLQAKLPLLSSANVAIGMQPRIIVLPPTANDGAIGAAMAIANATLATVVVTAPAGMTPAALVTTRTTTPAPATGGTPPPAVSGLARKDARLIICHGHLKNTLPGGNPAILEPLGAHLVGGMVNRSYGKSPLGSEIKGVNALDVTLTLSLSDESSDAEKLNDVGVVSVNLRPDGQLVIWGDRNSTYTESMTDPNTLINVIRARDAIALLARLRASKMLGESSDFSTASLLAESYRDMLSEEMRLGHLTGFSSVEIDETKTDYANLKIYHNLSFNVGFPLELVNINLTISAIDPTQSIARTQANEKHRPIL